MSERTERARSAIRVAVAPDAAARQESGTTIAPLGTSENPSTQILTLANAITFLRFILTIAFLFIFVQHDPTTRTLAVALYAIAASTDFLDGQIARRTQTVSWLGKVMDPIMDRVLLFTGVLGLMLTGELPVWVALVVCGRDAILAAGGVWLRCYQTRPLDVIYTGKVATALLMTGFADMLIAWPQVQGLNLTDASWLPGLNDKSCAFGVFLIYAGLVCSIAAAIIYYHQGLKIRRRVLDERRSTAS